MRKLVTALLVFGVLTAGAQGLVSLQAKLLKQRYEKNVAKARTRGETVVDDARAAFFVTCRKDADARSVATALEAKGAVVRIVRGQLIMLDMPITRLDDLADTEGVMKVALSPRVSRKTDITRRVTQAAAVNAGTAPQLPQAYTGKGVVVGIADLGFDLTHPTFKDQDGNLRIKAYYAPGNTTLDGEKVYLDGEMFTGSYLTKPEDLLDTTKVMCNYISHGTHCISIAAGSVMTDVTGISGEPLGGIAPEADILICDIESDDAHSEEMSEMGYDSEVMNISESLLFMKDQAEKMKKPLVVSLSYNSHENMHDGTSEMASFLGSLCKDDGLALMIATGNEGGSSCYLNKPMAAQNTMQMVCAATNPDDGVCYGYVMTGKQLKMSLCIYDLESEKVVYELPEIVQSDDDFPIIYYDMADEDDSSLSLRERLVYAKLKKCLTDGMFWAGCEKASAYDQNGQEYERIEVSLYHQNIVWSEDAYTEDGLLKYVFMLQMTPSEDTEIYAWGDYYDLIYIDNDGNLEYGMPDLSVGDYASSGEPVSVGAWVANSLMKMENGETIDTSEEVGAVAYFSSYGTDLAGHRHPDVCAPGNNIAAAYNSFVPGEDIYIHKAYTDQCVGQRGPRDYSWAWMSGTSMATPAVAGVVALWMQAAADLGKTLTCADIKDIIIHSCDTDEYTAQESDRFGYGKINAYKGLLYVLGIDTAIPGLCKDQPVGVSFRVADDVLFADGAEDGTTVALYDLSGVLVRQTAVQGGTVSLAGLRQGVYAVQLGRLGSTLIRK